MHHLTARFACTLAIGQQCTNIKNPTEGLLHSHGAVFYVKEGLETVYVTMVTLLSMVFFLNKLKKKWTREKICI